MLISQKNIILNHISEFGVRLKLSKWEDRDPKNIVFIPPSNKLYNNFTGLCFDEKTPCFTVSMDEWKECLRLVEDDFVEDRVLAVLANPIFDRFIFELKNGNDSVLYSFERLPVNDDDKKFVVKICLFYYYSFGKDQKQNYLGCDSIFSGYSCDLENGEIDHSVYSSEIFLRNSESQELDAEGLKSLFRDKKTEWDSLCELCYLQTLLTKKKATSYLVKPKKLPPSAKPKNSKGKPMKHHAESECILICPNADKKVYIPASAEELEVKKTGTPKRPHTRRGTMRHLKSGKIVPVKPSKIKGGGAGGRVYSLVMKKDGEIYG